MKGKRNLISKKHCEEDLGEDRISKLPDNLVHEILSFIDSKFAVQTCILSKRWKNVWISLPCIKSSWGSFLTAEDERSVFIDKYVTINRVHDKFEGFVDKVLEFHKDSDIQMLKLGIFILNDTLIETLNRWILAAVNHNVQVLTLSIIYHPDSPYEIPVQLLNCKSLKSLNITFVCRHFRCYRNITLPKSMSLPQIKRLSLKGISISNLELQRLFSSCPPMEMVSIQECDVQMNNQRSIIIDSHSLQLSGLIDRFDPLYCSAINFLTCTIKISAPNVKEFRCTGFMTEDFSLENFSSLVGAHLNMRLRGEGSDETAETYSSLLAEEKEVFAKRMMKYLGEVHRVHHLTLSSGFLEVLLQAPGMLNRQHPQLCNLETLKLEMRFTRGCLRSVAYLLKISPIIMSLILKSKESNLADIGDDWEAEFSSTGMLSHLKSVQIREVEGSDNELKFLIFLLKNSTVLQKVILFFRSTSDSLHSGRQVRKFKRSVRKLPTASSSIQVHLFDL